MRIKKLFYGICCAAILCCNIFTAPCSAYTYREPCAYCGKMCYYTYTSNESAGADDTPVPCTIHENCVITKRELYYITTDAENGCGCKDFLLHHNIGRTHSEYTTHSAYGRIHTPLK